MQRRIREITPSRATIEGVGVRLHRAIGFGPPEQYDPFLLLDDFRSDAPDDYVAGFPWHPHRGIETITYVLRGSVEHRDTLGNRGVIGPGDVQWMTAGSGVIHQEMPSGDAEGAMYGFQLWANLPHSHKMMPPRYRGVRASSVPQVRAAGRALVRVIAGTVDGVAGPVRDIVTAPQYLDVTLPPEATFIRPIPPGHTVLMFAIEGHGAAGGRTIRDGELGWFGDGDDIAVSAGAGPFRFLLIAGQPIREPIAWAGPIVMNTQDELQRAFDELDEGTFIKDHDLVTMP